MFNKILIAATLFFCIVSSSVSANWLGPYDTHSEADLWLRSAMEKKNYVLQNEDAGFNIMNYGAVPTTRSQQVSEANGLAFYNTVLAANSSSSISNRVVIIPAGYNFWYVPHDAFKNLVNISIQFNGNISAYPDNQTAWPSCNGNAKCHVITVDGGSDVSFVGNGGIINGYGFKWWVNQFPPNKGGHRPMLINIENMKNVVLHQMGLYDSPYYHFICNNVVGLLIQYSRVEVSIFEQYALHKKHGTFLHEGIDLPLTFPLNTDGFDLRGNSIVVRGCHVENFDDCYCPKPQGMNSPSGCTQNILIQDSSIHYGVGASIGSVPPGGADNCVRNVTFDRITWDTPIKAIYVKPNPGNSGWGLVRDITYKNSYAKMPLWWGIYVSTQQQHQPGGASNTGCSFFYPLPNTSCPTQPRVPVQNLFLDNITMEDSLLSPGILRCNDTNVGPLSGPCTGWVWNNVQTTSLLKWPMGDHYLCHAIENPSWTGVSSTCQYNSPFDNHHHQQNQKQQHRYQEILSSLSTQQQQQQNGLSSEAKQVLDELALIMKQKGISLWNIMNRNRK